MRITLITLTALAIAAPAATAMPDPGAVRMSSLAATTSPQLYRRSPDARDASAKPLPRPVHATPRDGDGDASPLVDILPVALASLLVAAGMGHAVRMSDRVGSARIGA